MFKLITSGRENIAMRQSRAAIRIQPLSSDINSGPGRRVKSDSVNSESAMASVKIIYKDPARLKARGNNPRTHSRKQINQIVASIQQFGFVGPVLVDRQEGISAT
jgi:hypothetical protein